MRHFSATLVFDLKKMIVFIYAAATHFCCYLLKLFIQCLWISVRCDSF